ALWVLIGTASLAPRAITGNPPLELHLKVKAHEAISEALRYLVASQRSDGGWEAFGRSHPAIAALVVKCLVQDDDYGRSHPAAKRGLEFILRYVQPDGGIYVPGEGMRNYHTSVALLALAATKDPAHTKTIKNAQRFLRKLQWDDGEGHEASSPFYGGQGYGKHKRPDLSNTQLMLEALHQSGLPADDPVYQKALVFISRCQMLGDTNDQPFARGSDDGGFVYTPANEGESKAGTETVDGRFRLRSYGSMTYAGFKSMLYARVDRDDVRVQRAVDWISRYYTLDHNPNMPHAQSKQGLYYYYHVLARAMYAWGEAIIRDAHGMPHRWRVELCEKLLSLQRDDGSWVNEEDRWYEGNPNLVTAYAVLAIQTALSP
ncbi:MAG: prenyltransferase/squalene oxidase repeat-containing protein, partial [Phycisphaerae bacterium]